MLLLLIQAFNPLSFDYSFVWLLFPIAVALGLILDAPSGSRERGLLVAGLAVALGVFALALPFHRTAKAYGNLLAADLLLLATLGGWLMSGVPRRGGYGPEFS